MLAGIDLTFSNVFYNYALLSTQSHATRGIVTANVLEKLGKGFFETTQRCKSKHARFAIEQLDISLVCATDLDRYAQDISQTAVDVVSFFGAERSDLVETPHSFKVSSAVFENSEKTRLTIAQFFRAFRHLLFESVFGLAKFLFQCFLRRQISYDNTD